MSFGGYNYGPDETDSDDDAGPRVIEAQYPDALRECDHPNCKRESGAKHRICTECTEIMLSNTDDRCDFCGESVN